MVCPISIAGAVTSISLPIGYLAMYAYAIPASQPPRIPPQRPIPPDQIWNMLPIFPEYTPQLSATCTTRAPITPPIIPQIATL